MPNLTDLAIQTKREEELNKIPPPPPLNNTNLNIKNSNLTEGGIPSGNYGQMLHDAYMQKRNTPTLNSVTNFNRDNGNNTEGGIPSGNYGQMLHKEYLKKINKPEGYTSYSDLDLPLKSDTIQPQVYIPEYLKPEHKQEDLGYKPYDVAEVLGMNNPIEEDVGFEPIKQYERDLSRFLPDGGADVSPELTPEGGLDDEEVEEDWGSKIKRLAMTVLGGGEKALDVATQYYNEPAVQNVRLANAYEQKGNADVIANMFKAIPGVRNMDSVLESNKDILNRQREQQLKATQAEQENYERRKYNLAEAYRQRLSAEQLAMQKEEFENRLKQSLKQKELEQPRTMLKNIPINNPDGTKTDHWIKVDVYGNAYPLTEEDNLAIQRTPTTNTTATVQGIAKDKAIQEHSISLDNVTQRFMPSVAEQFKGQHILFKNPKDTSVFNSVIEEINSQNRLVNDINQAMINTNGDIATQNALVKQKGREISNRLNNSIIIQGALSNVGVIQPSEFLRLIGQFGISQQDLEKANPTMWLALKEGIKKGIDNINIDAMANVYSAILGSDLLSTYFENTLKAGEIGKIARGLNSIQKSWRDTLKGKEIRQPTDLETKYLGVNGKFVDQNTYFKVLDSLPLLSADAFSDFANVDKVEQPQQPQGVIDKVVNKVFNKKPPLQPVPTPPPVPINKELEDARNNKPELTEKEKLRRRFNPPPPTPTPQPVIIDGKPSTIIERG